MTPDDRDPATREADRTEQHPDRDAAAFGDDVDVQLRVPYGRVGGRTLMLDLFTPRRMPDRPRPAIVFLHGGSWKAGSPSQFHFHAAHLATHYDMFAVSVDYRLSGEAPFPAALHDANCAVRWVRSRCDEQRIDPTRIAVCGGSAGAHLASMMLVAPHAPEYQGDGGHDDHSSAVNLGILFNGEFDMWDLVERGSLIGPMRQFIGATPEQAPDRYTELSAVRRVHAAVPPVLLLHGTADLCVSHEQSIVFADRLRALGVHAEVELYEGKPHAWFNREPDRTTTLQRMERFLVEHFALGKADDA